MLALYKQIEEGFTEASCTIIARAMRICSSGIPPDDVPVVMAEVGKPSDVVVSSVNELDICSLMDIV